ncbi:neurobeachin-like protein 2 [Rhopilema esculentum]|uniref:neurobeachin-like protein 2 n=1 Tax=Rhopilema esculentum TaxID=499914 RepID=UPI0031CFCD0B
MEADDDLVKRDSSESIRLLLSYESNAIRYTDNVFFCIMQLIRDTLSQEKIVENDDSYDVALRCLLKVFQDLPLSDHMNILPDIVGLLKQRVTECNVLKKVKICEKITEVIKSSKLRGKYSKWTEIIVGNCVQDKVDIFQGIKDFMETKINDDYAGNQRAKVCLDLITLIVKEGSMYKTVFLDKFGEDSLAIYLKRQEKISHEVVDSLFQLLVNGNWIPDNYCNVIANGEVANVLIDILPCLSSDLQRHVCETLRVICAVVAHNRIIACQYDLIGNIIKLLKNGENLQKQTLSCLISLLEILGSLSIKPDQLKVLIGLFKSNEETGQVSYNDRLLQALERMASQVDARQPRHFIDFYDPTDIFALSAPSFLKWNGRGITFHTWLCLDFSLPTPKTRQFKVRHMLYSFLSSTGEGFEAFFTEKGYLIIAVCTKKDYFASSVTELPFGDQEWHSLAIVHTKKSFGRSFVTVYVDGQHFHQALMKYPVTDDLVYSTIGYGVRFNPNFYYNMHPSPVPIKQVVTSEYPGCTAAGQQNRVWGEVSSLKGQISSVYLFNESLSQATIADVYFAGPNSWSNKKFSDGFDTLNFELTKQLVLHFDAKAASGDTCLDLSPPSNFKSKCSQNLSARVCSAWDIKSSIQCIGGLPVLFPLLEQVKYSETPAEKLSRDINLPMIKGPESLYARSISLVKETPSQDIANDITPTEPMSFNHFGETISEGDPEENTSGNETELTSHDKKTMLTTAHHEEAPRHSSVAKEEALPILPKSADRRQREGQGASTGSFLLIDSPELPKSNITKRESTEEWILIDKSTARTRNVTFSKWTRDDDNYYLNGAAYFISLLRNMLLDQKTAQDFFLQSKGVQIMGLVLQKCDPRIINVGFLMSVQALVESFSRDRDDLLKAIYQHILFDFRIWTDSDISVRIAHVQLLSTYVKDSPEYFSESFGVRFIMQIVNTHYNGNQRHIRRENGIGLGSEDRKCVRMALLGLVSFYLKSFKRAADVSALVNYIATLQDLELLSEIVEIVKHMLETAGENQGDLMKSVADSDLPIIYTRWLVHDVKKKIRLDILKTLWLLLSSTKVHTAVKSKIRLKNVGYDSVCTLLSKQAVTHDVVISLLSLAQSSEQTSLNGVDIFVHFDIILAVLSLIRTLSPHIKLEVALKVRHSLKCYPQSAKKCAQIAAWYVPFLELIVIHPDSELSSEHDQIQDELVEVVLEIIHLSMWKGIDGSDPGVWKERGQPLAALHQMAARNEFILPVLVIEKKLLKKCINACSVALKESVQPWAVDTMNAIQIVKLVEDFLLSTEFSETSNEVWKKKWDIEILNSLHDLLDAMNAWEDSTEAGSEWTDVLQTVEKILFECGIAEDALFISYAAEKLRNMLSRRRITSRDEACYEVGCLNRLYKELISRDDSSSGKFLPVFRVCFERFHDVLNSDNLLPNLPSLDRSTREFEAKFPDYFTSDEYCSFANQTARVTKRYKETSLSTNSIDIGRFWMDCLSAMDAAIKTRSHSVEESLQNFSRSVYAVFEETRIAARASQVDAENFLKHNLSMTNRLWEDRKKFLTSERGAWTERKIEKAFWKLSSTENSSRMRLKLVRNFNGSEHNDASRLRDQDTEYAVTPQEIMEINIPVSLQEQVGNELVLSGEEEPDETDAAADPVEPTEHMYDLNPLEESVGKVVLSVNCHLITLMDVVPGRIELSLTHISFFDESNDSVFGSACDFWFQLEKLQEMHMRRYNLRKTGLEFFLIDRSSYLINFASNKERDNFFKKTTSVRPPNLYYSGIKSPQRLLRVSHLTQRWVKREITNFDYLMQLNTIAGRTYNDLAQYPIFPWVITDYESNELDLQNPSVFRDLSRPIGALNPDRLEGLEIRYKDLVDPSGFQLPCHYLTHYSNAAIVLHYLLRVEPFTSLHIKLQGGRFDCPDRQFYSIAKSWNGIMNGAGDVRELIPEFFCFPDFLSNINKLDLGNLQAGKKIDDVLLPPWASSPDEFIYKQRLALESEHVSMNLHHWIDLIFGYKQRGDEAVKAYNVFHHYSYEGSVDLDVIDDPFERKAVEGIINNFGQTPCQLLNKPHPVRRSVEELKQQASKQKHVLEDLNSANFSLIKVNTNGPPLIFLGTQKTRQRSLLHHGMPDPLITVDKNSVIGFHGWLPYSEDKSGSFSFALDPNLNQKSSRARNSLNRHQSTWSPDVPRTSQLFAFTPDGKLLICCGFWDDSIRVLNGKGKLLSVIYQHLDVVSCVSLDPSGHYFISGSYDARCMVWRIQHHAGLATEVLGQPLQTLYGHDNAVNTVGMIWELDMAVSGSKDGSCIIHTIKKGQFVMTLRPDPLLLDSNICKVCLTKYGKVMVYSTHNYKDGVDYVLSTYTVNGNLIAKMQLNEAILDMIVVEEHLISGGVRGSLVVRDVHKLEVPIIAKNLQYPIHCVSATPDCTHIFACREDGNVIVVGS